MSKSKKLPEITCLRAIAILSVVWIHVSSFFITDNSWGYLATNRWNLYSVPCFMLVSGIVLTYSSTLREFNASKFYTKRIFSVLVPYVAFSIFYTVFSQTISRQINLFSVEGFYSFLEITTLSIFLQEGAYYHLYFMYIIIQFYLLFPIWFKMLSNKLFRITSIPLAYGIQLLFQKFYPALTIEHPLLPSPSAIMFNYLFIFAVGCSLGYSYLKVRSRINWIWVSIFTIISIFLSYDFITKINSRWETSKNLEPTSFEYTWFTITISITLLMVLITLSKSIGNLKFLRLLGNESFSVYLFHPFFLSLLYTRLSGFHENPYFPIILWTLCIGLSLLSAKALQQLSFGRYLLGLSQIAKK
ncbi:acyltransferase [Bacillus cereus]|uniref:Acyltransferase 3 n=1 Tax=Bacillus cereus TaxID=1396 RepID=A0A164QNY6_BACCE|nr:acyltransferase [Bacillus cereus]KZD71972.1 Acyltransferase 3 [Bacillus cereus]